MRQDASVSDDIEADVVSDEEVPQRTLGAISFANLDETDFEGFCFDLLIELGFVNVDWRKGTPKWPVRPTAAATFIAQLERATSTSTHSPSSRSSAMI